MLQIDSKVVDRHWSIVLAGPLDFLNANRLAERLRFLAAKGQTTVCLDAAGVTMLDSSGIGVLVTGQKLLTAAGGNLRIANASRVVHEVLVVTGLIGYFQLSAAESAPAGAIS